MHGVVTKIMGSVDRDKRNPKPANNLTCTMEGAFEMKIDEAQPGHKASRAL